MLNAIEQALYDYIMLDECEISMKYIHSLDYSYMLPSNLISERVFFKPIKICTKNSGAIKNLVRCLCGSAVFCNEDILLNPSENIVYITGGLFKSTVVVKLNSRFGHILKTKGGM